MEQIIIDFNEMFLTGQALVFFAAGFETSSTTISNTLYELALHHDIQDNLRREILQVVKSNGGKLTYESIKEMKYLDKVVKGIYKDSVHKYKRKNYIDNLLLPRNIEEISTWKFFATTSIKQLHFCWYQNNNTQGYKSIHSSLGDSQRSTNLHRSRKF